MLQPACPAASVRSEGPVSAERRIHHARTAATVALIASAVLIGVLAPQAVAARTAAQPARPVQTVQPAQTARTAQLALPLPLPVAAVEPLVTEGVGIEGPLINNLTLPTLK
ncbi:hypothetical protein OHS59_20645 [Streptomyces sp. NBC_00414]|uniref:hypothetical protein n=1 Tax=Streptomyces sp. NBC_00414 TaxID=2975739 RepID=UPI002E1B0DC2